MRSHISDYHGLYTIACGLALKQSVRFSTANDLVGHEVGCFIFRNPSNEMPSQGLDKQIFVSMRGRMLRPTDIAGANPEYCLTCKLDVVLQFDLDTYVLSLETPHRTMTGVIMNCDLNDLVIHVSLYRHDTISISRVYD